MGGGLSCGDDKIKMGINNNDNNNNNNNNNNNDDGDDGSLSDRGCRSLSPQRFFISDGEEDDELNDEFNQYDVILSSSSSSSSSSFSDGEHGFKIKEKQDIPASVKVGQPIIIYYPSFSELPPSVSMPNGGELLTKKRES
jgi:hypothetical protein